MSDTSGSMPPFEEPILLDDAPAWPKHVGILSIIWAVIGISCAGCFATLTLASPALINMIPDEAARAKAQQQPPQSPLALVSLFSSVALGALLMVAGINTLRRRPLGRTLHLVWAIAGLLLIVAGVVDALLHMPVLDKWAKDNPGADAAKMVSSRATMIQVILATAIRLIWPTFCLIWFGLVKRTPEAMTGKPLPAGPG